MPSERIVMVAAVADNGVIGNGPDIPWKIPGEQAEFKAITMGHTLVMGRTTFESIGRPLPGRTTVVLTKDETWAYDGVLVARDIDTALALAADQQGDTIIAGGAQVYAAALPHATDQVITRVHLEPVGDVLYPPFDQAEWVETKREPHEAYDRVFLTRIEVAATSDLDELWPVYDAIFGDRTRDAFVEQWNRHRVRDGFRVATARRGGEVVGLAWAYLGDRGQWWSDRIADALPEVAGEWIGGHWEVVELGVLEAWRGHGLGRALVRAVTDVPHERMLLETDADETHPAHRLYLSEGWQEVARVPGSNNVVMGKRHPSAGSRVG